MLKIDDSTRSCQYLHLTWIPLERKSCPRKVSPWNFPESAVRCVGFSASLIIPRRQTWELERWDAWFAQTYRRCRGRRKKSSFTLSILTVLRSVQVGNVLKRIKDSSDFPPPTNMTFPPKSEIKISIRIWGLKSGLWEKRDHSEFKVRILSWMAEFWKERQNFWTWNLSLRMGFWGKRNYSDFKLRIPGFKSGFCEQSQNPEFKVRIPNADRGTNPLLYQWAMCGFIQMNRETLDFTPWYQNTLSVSQSRQS